ncbi:MAG: YhfC family intramembrane metalloprotease [Chloroflexi bacterium]|nr:YhfC family intramembrane metalloprotease [Chloroflexota bacterium]
MILRIDPAWLAFDLINVLFMIAYPIVTAVWARSYLRVSWRYIGYGALIFFLFQLISRIPAIQIIQIGIAPVLARSPSLLWGWLLALAISAGLFEEIGRYVGYRWLMGGEVKSWPRAVMYGIGHGGLECWFTALLAAASLVNLLILGQTDLSTLPPAARAEITRQIAALNAQPVWFPLLGAWERLWTLPVQVALSVVVLQVFQRRQFRWLWFAVAAHALVDLCPLALNRILARAPLTASLLSEALLAIFGLIALATIIRFRTMPTAEPDVRIGAHTPGETAPPAS